MPITRRQFELEIDPKTEGWMKEIHSFLAEHKDEAFTVTELHEYYRPTLLELLSGVQKTWVERQQVRHPFSLLPDENKAFDLALEKLVELGAVGKAAIRDSWYYAYRRKLEEVF